MAERLFDATDVAELRDVVETELAHAGSRRTITRETQDGEPIARVTWGDATACHLIDDAATVAELAAIRQVEATYVIKFALGTVVKANDIWRVTASDDDGNEATRQVRLTSVEPLKHLSIVTTAVDDATADPTTLETET